jgi:signal peptidase I
MTSPEIPSAEELRQQCTRIVRLAMEALTRAIQRRDAVRADVLACQQQLAYVSAELRTAEAALLALRAQVQQVLQERALRRAAQERPVVVRSAPPVEQAAFIPPVVPLAQAPLSAVADVWVTSRGISPAQAAEPVQPTVSTVSLAAALLPVSHFGQGLLHRFPKSSIYRHIPTGLLAVMLFGLAVLLTPVSQLVGWEIFAVLSGSMEPTIKVGGIVAVHPVPADQLKVGDVITFVDQNRPDTFVTHRIVELSVTDGQATAKTKGDANNTADAWSVPANKAVGRVDLSLPYLGFLMIWLSSPLAKVAILGIAVLGLAVPSVGRRSSLATAASSAAPMTEPKPAAPLAEPKPAAPVTALAPPVIALVPLAPAAREPSFQELEREIQQMLGDSSPSEQRRAA